MTENPTANPVLTSIVKAPLAWLPWDQVETRWPGELERLLAEGLIARWERPDGVAVTLTPLSAERLQVEIEEHWKYRTEDVGLQQTPPSHHVERIAEEVPRWGAVQTDAHGVLCFSPLVLPRHAHEAPQHYQPPDSPAHSRARPALDPYTGEPMRLLGRPVTIDPRMKPRRKRQRAGSQVRLGAR